MARSGRVSVLVEERDDVRWIWLNRPRVHNAQDADMLRRLTAAFDDVADAARRGSVRAVVLGGRGVSFSAGHDLREMQANPEHAEWVSTAEGRWRREATLFIEPIRALEAIGVPTVARVHGHCVAGGLLLMAACDLAVAGDDVTFTSPTLRRQGVNDVQLPTFTRLLGVRRAKQFLWLDEEIGAAEAHSLGLVNEVVPLEQLDEAVERIVERLGQVPPVALELSKHSFRFLRHARGDAMHDEYHFALHQFSRQTSESRGLLRRRLARLRRGGGV